MKIGILTQPLQFNYGGLLQAYALQKTLKKMGHEVWIINRIPEYQQGKVYRRLSKVKYFLYLCSELFLLRKTLTEVMDMWKVRNLPYLTFVEEYLKPKSPLLDNDEKLLKFVCKKGFQAYVVGSDQVWRPSYSPNIYNYFLDFADNNSIKCAYAASFGTDDWEFTLEETNICKHLLARFNKVSVRERSGIEMCAKYLEHKKVEWVLDPTMLLTVKDYSQLTEDAHLPNKREAHIVSYILDETSSKKKILDIVQSLLGKEVYNAKNGIPFCNESYFAGKASVEEWLYGFQYAEFAVIDSFHGCVFSILYHVPFIVIANKERGMSRFESLLSVFGLEDRLVDENFDGTELQEMQSIDWKNVDFHLASFREASFAFLSKALS